MNHKYLLVLIGLFFVGQAMADVVWDEAVDGDLSNVGNMPTQVALTDLTNIVIGSVGGNFSGGEGRDTFTFVVPPGFVLESIILNDYMAEGGNDTSSFHFYRGNMGEANPRFSLNSMGEANISQNTIDTPSDLLPAGSYSMMIVEGTPGQSYELNIVMRITTGWEEAVDGDLSNVSNMPTQVALTDLTNIVTGTVGGDTDVNDGFTFVVPAGFALEGIILDDYIAANGNESSGFNFFLGDVGSANPQFSFNAMGEANIGQNTLTINTPNGLLPPGSYSMVIRESEDPGQSYQLNILLQSTTVWNEAVDGDLSNVGNMPTQVALTDLTNTVIGTVGGGSQGDFIDVFTFVVPPGFALEAIILKDYIAADENETTRFALHSGDTSTAPRISNENMGEANIGQNTITIDTPSGLLPSGSYSMEIQEATPGLFYELDIQLIFVDLIFIDGFDE